MVFRNNPWIDPRIEQVRLTQVEHYLNHHGWKEGNSKISPMRAFRNDSGAAVFLPAKDDDEFVRFAIDSVAELARAENRFAGEVLTDILLAPTANAAASVGRPMQTEYPDAMAPTVGR